MGPSGPPKTTPVRVRDASWLVGDAWHAVKGPRQPAAHPSPLVWARCGPFVAVFWRKCAPKGRSRKMAKNRNSEGTLPLQLPGFGGCHPVERPKRASKTPHRATKNRPYLGLDGPNRDSEGTFPQCNPPLLAVSIPQNGPNRLSKTTKYQSRHKKDSSATSMHVHVPPRTGPRLGGGVK